MITLTNLKVWDGVSDSLAEDIDSLTIDDGRIIEASALPAHRGRGEVRDMGGLTVTPGLIDAHVHLCLDPEITVPEDQSKPSDEEILAQMSRRASLMLSSGITTARDLGGGKWLEFEIRDRIDRGETRGPRLLCAGQPITSVKGHCHFWGGEAADVGEALEVLARQVDRGADLIKVMATGGNLTKGSKPADAQFDEASLAQIVAQARHHDRHVAAHCHGTEGIANAARAGVRTIEHCSWVGTAGWARAYDPGVARAIATGGVWVSPTINLGWQRRVGSGEYEALVQGNFRAMREAGVKLIASTDAGIPNVYHPDLPRALPLFAHFAGLTPVETLRAATSDCAEAIGLGEVTGRIATGMSADLLFMEDNPLEDLAALAAPVDVMSRGVAVTGVAGPV